MLTLNVCPTLYSLRLEFVEFGNITETVGVV
jgi:hypothetical protein